MTERYSSINDLPGTLPIFPLAGAMLLPRGVLPLNIFEPRYVSMVDAALRSGDRLIGMIQPQTVGPADAGTSPAIHDVGCAGRITGFNETDDGRILMTLTGICRFKVSQELDAMTAFRQVKADYAPFANDLEAGSGELDVSRTALLDVVRRYLDANNLQADWDAIEQSSNEALVNSLSMISPFGPQEKQAMLEADSLEQRNQILIALAEMALAQTQTDDDTTLQ
ncbi:LON peptidase substrate-binding domain-containing protein [Pyruvatibacter sp.]|uniref:LON peptidase substrate-binding domain-containing protein n=1 Tax=Pyruvatibacter sp. TaxID=1981328 RepID=UPI002969D56B|nr:LON peptidase substrate-binding domain-containing protein [Alphaproteobacteria bacterium]